MSLHRRDTLRLFGMGAAAAMLPASAIAQAKKLRIAFANYNDEASFGAVVRRGFQNAAKAHPEFEVLFYDNRQDGQRAVENARLVATIKPDVFVEYNAIVPEVNPQIARLMKDAGIPVLSIQVRVPDTPVFAIDNSLSGYDSAKGAAMAAKEKWANADKAILLLAIPEGGPMFQERTAAARKAMSDILPGVDITEFSTKNDPGVARQVMTDFLTKNPGKKVVTWVHVDGMALAALTAARNAGREQDILIGSTGGETVALTEIRKPNSVWVGTFSFFPEQWGFDVLPLAARIAKGEKVADITRPKRQLFVTAKNIDEHYPKS
jgi:ABC-type sugar transport system substrate-binding protein